MTTAARSFAAAHSCAERLLPELVCRLQQPPASLSASGGSDSECDSDLEEDTFDEQRWLPLQPLQAPLKPSLQVGDAVFPVETRR